MLVAIVAFAAADAFAGPPAGGRVVATTPKAAAPSGIEWRTDIEQALKAAEHEHRPILIDFWATWCGPCKQMEAELWSRPDVVPLMGKFVCLKVDIDRNPGMTNRFRAEAVPTLVLWGASDRIVTPAYGRAYAARIPGARFEIIEAAGHHPEIEQPGTLAERVRAFLPS